MFGFGKDDNSEPKKMAPTSAGKSLPKTSSSTPERSTGPRTILAFSDLGMKKALTGGPDALYDIPVGLREKIAAIDRGDRVAWIVFSVDVCANPDTTLIGHERQLSGSLKAKGYRVSSRVAVSAELMGEIKRSAATQKAGMVEGGGAPLDLYNCWIDAAVRCNASDLHVLLWSNNCTVRVRVDGALEPLKIDGGNGVYSREAGKAAVAAAFNYANRGAGSSLSQYDESVAADCMIEREVDGKQILQRYQNIAAPSGGKEYGAKVVVRLLQADATGVAGNFNDAGYAPSHVRNWKLSSRAGKGMVIIAGVTGSGKSTTAKIYIETLPDLAAKAIETVEDPIEYVIAPGKVHQGQVTRDLSNPEVTRQRYGVALKSLMRGDIDGVLVGEVRDDVSARFMLQVAETGHLAMCSLHAHLISNIIPRLTNEEVGLTRQEMTSPQIINLLVYQALVPKLCQECCMSTDEALEGDPTGEVADVVATLTNKFKLDTNVLLWKRPTGCHHCSGRGTKGRTMVAEMFAPDRKWLELVRDGKDFDALMHYRSLGDGNLHSPDMTGKTVFEHTMWKAITGLVDIRNCEEFESLERYEFAPPKAATEIKQIRASA